MAGAKGSKLAARNLKGGPRKHYCPVCVEKNGFVAATEATAVMIMPKKRMSFQCDAGHAWHRTETILA